MLGGIQVAKTKKKSRYWKEAPNQEKVSVDACYSQQWTGQPMFHHHDTGESCSEDSGSDPAAEESTGYSAASGGTEDSRSAQKKGKKKGKTEFDISLPARHLVSIVCV